MLMDNHYHMILETPRGNLCKIMHYINASYATYYNTRHKRVGPLYQGRYKSIIVQADEYLHHLSRYIHLNPVRAEIVKSPEEYQWSSYRYFVGGGETLKYLDIEFILSMFDSKLKKAKELYKEFVLKGIGKEERIIKENLKKGFVLGDDDFLKAIIDRYIDKDEDSEIPLIREIKKTKEPSLEIIQKIVSGEVGSGTRIYRQLFLYLSRKYTQKTLNEIGVFCGGISDTGVSQACKRARQRRKEEGSFDKLLGKIEKEIEMSSMEI